jgi:Transposase
MDISADTIRRVFVQNSLHAYVKRKKPFLQKKHRQTRLSFAKEYEHWTVKDWSKIIWSDESKFVLLDGKQYCWRRSGESLQDDHVTPTVKYGGGSIMGWECMTFHGLGHLCRIDIRGLDSELYCQI